MGLPCLTSLPIVRAAEQWTELSMHAWSEGVPEPCVCLRLRDSVENPCLARRHAWRTGSPRTEVDCSVTHCLYQNIWRATGFQLERGGPAPDVHLLSTCRSALIVLPLPVPAP